MMTCSVATHHGHLTMDSKGAIFPFIYQVGTGVSPFGLHPRFVRHAFSLHEFLHGIGVDYWTDRVSFVGSRVLLFHCLLTSTEWKKKPHLSHCRQKRWAECFPMLIPLTDSSHT